jgi:linoleoyl-CoA desaturase
MTTQKIRFDAMPHLHFQQVLKQRVDAYFAHSKQSKRANVQMHLKSITFVALTLASYLALLLTHLSFEATLLLYLSFGLNSAFLVISVAHDASHNAYFSDKNKNHRLSQLWYLVGMSPYVWHYKHHLSHHAFTNVPDLDIDISQSTDLLRFNPTAERKAIHRFQHLYAPFLYFIFGIFAIFYRDFKFFQERKFGNVVIEAHSRKEWYKLVTSKALYVVFGFLLPYFCLDFAFGTVLLMFVLSVCLSGFYMILILVPPHLNGDTHFAHPNESGVIENSWFIHELESTTDCAANSKLMHFFSGGLNTHVAHHLFPQICHIHYPHLTPIIKQTAQDFGYKYTNKSYYQNLKDHFAFLKTLGQ